VGPGDIQHLIWDHRVQFFTHVLLERNFILAVLRQFGFGTSYIQWVKILLKSCIQNNKTVSDWFNIKGGTKQGDPISLYLFLLSIEMMTRSNPNFQGVKPLEEFEETKMVLFADDATFCIKNVESLHNVLKTYSSLELNLKKGRYHWKKKYDRHKRGKFKKEN